MNTNNQKGHGDPFKDQIAQGMEIPAEAPEVQLPLFPEEAYVGLAGEVAGWFAEYLESPKQFFYLDYLTHLGALLAVHVKLDTALREEPRLYLLKLGESWGARKSSSQDEIDYFFRPISQDRLNRNYGAGSAEGLAEVMKSGLSTLLILDEFRSFVSKAQGVKGSVLLPMVTSLYSKTHYQNSTRNSNIDIPDAHLSITGACTVETFQTTFTPEFRSIGALNRLFLVAGKREKLRPLPMPLPSGTLSDLQRRTMKQIDEAELKKPVIPFTAEAVARWEDIYREIHERDNPYTARLDTYGLRFLMLFAITTGSPKIGPELVEAVRVLLDYQYELRKEVDPLDAEGITARIERAIVRQLRKGRMADRDLRRACNASRTGLWAFEAAMQNLKKAEWATSKIMGRRMFHWMTPQGMEQTHE